MAGRRQTRGRSASTSALALWGTAMLLLGLGLGWLFSQGCDRRKAPSPPKPISRSESKSEAHGATKPSKPDSPTGSTKPAPLSETAELPRMALVIDDLGYAAPELVRRLCAQPIAFSAAVLPYLEFSRESATVVHEAGKEVMLHLPMEPVGYPGPGKDPGPNAVMANLSESETRARVKKALLEVPYRRGVNNHMGSRLTPNRERMGWVLQEIKEAKCFFLDSRTEKDSVAFEVARKLGMPALQRQVFLDDSKEFDDMAKQWERALELAKRDGQVVVIAHIYPETVAALEKLEPRAKGRVAFVKASALLP